MKTNWQTKKLGDVCDFQNGFAFKGGLFKENGLPVLRISNIQNDGISYKRLVFFNKNDYKEDFNKYQALKGDLVIAMSGATTGKLAICDADEIFYLNQRVGKFKPKKDLLNNYLYYFLSTRIEENLKISTGSAQPNLSTEQIKALQIPIPTLSEQHRIVKILDETFEKIEKAKENTEKNLGNSQELFKSYLQSVFVNPKKNWKIKTLKEITSVLGDGLHGTPKYSVDGEYYFINGNNLNNGNIIFKENTKKVAVEEYDKYKKNLNSRTVLVSINGTLCNIAFYNNEKIILGKSACYFNLLNGVDKNFIKYIILSPYFIKYAFKEATGATIKNVSLKTMRAFQIHLPEFEEQGIIVAKLDKLSAETKKLEVVYKRKLADLEELKKSVLKRAFNGDL